MRLYVYAFRVYFAALAIAVRSAIAGRLRDGLKLLIAPVGYWRFLPNAFVLEEFQRCGARRVLDVSSPKVLSLILARRAEIWATDLDDEQIFLRWKPVADALGLERYRVRYEDACHLGFSDESFDLVYSISVIEHIPGSGDTSALQEFRRVLKPGGKLVVEVPYRRERREVYTGYDSKGKPLPAPRFYERHYDGAWLDQRLRISGLELERKLILGEWLPLDPWIAAGRLPRFLRLAALPLEPFLAAFNYWARTHDRAGRPLAALLVYRKVGP
jgi:SAM-dependent methyltransferase